MIRFYNMDYIYYCTLRPFTTYPIMHKNVILIDTPDVILFLNLSPINQYQNVYIRTNMM